MSRKYDEYLAEHLANVRKAGEWLMDHGIVPFDDYDCRNKLNNWLLTHDESKTSAEEYEAYDEYFYPTEDTDRETAAECFDYAWLHHIHHNCHHWQYWILYEDEGKTKALEMPMDCVFHMIADWWSFSWKSGKLDEIFDWYEQHKEKMLLHPRTRRQVETALNMIREII